jgi:hypothetical protein
MLSVVQFRERNFLLQTDVDDETSLMLETCLPKLDLVEGSFRIKSVEGADSGTQVVIEESPLPVVLPYDAWRGFEAGEDGLGEVYIFCTSDERTEFSGEVILWAKYSDDELTAQH